MEIDKDKDAPKSLLAEPSNHLKIDTTVYAKPITVTHDALFNMNRITKTDIIVTAKPIAVPDELFCKTIDVNTPNSSRLLDNLNESTNCPPFSYITPKSKRNEENVKYASLSQNHNDNWGSFEENRRNLFPYHKPPPLKSVDNFNMT